MASVNDQDREIALVTIKMWLKENDAAYLAKEDRIVYWEHFNNDSKRGQYQQLTLRECCRVIKATRSGFDLMKYIKPELVMLAAQEEGRAYKQGINSRSNAPTEYFNFCRINRFTDFEMLTLCMLQELVGRGWNVEAVCLGDLMMHIFKVKGYIQPNRTLRWRLLRAVAEEAGVLIRDRTDRLTVYGVGRFVCVQIKGIDDSIRVDFTQEEKDELAQQSIFRFVAA